MLLSSRGESLQKFSPLKSFVFIGDSVWLSSWIVSLTTMALRNINISLQTSDSAQPAVGEQLAQQSWVVSFVQLAPHDHDNLPIVCEMIG